MHLADHTTDVVSIAPLVRLSGVSFRYGNGPTVLDDVSLTVRPGEFTGLVGPSGSGKTTLLQVLLGTAQPSSGSVESQDGLRIGYVPQVETINWNFPLTVFEAVVMSATARRMRPWATRSEKSRVADVLDRLGIGELSKRHIRQLSGGQQQRMFIARALFGSPDLLLLDEPTSGVDVRTRHEVLHLLGDLNRGGLTVVLTTHDLNGIAAHLPKVVCLHTKVMGEGSPMAVLTPDILEKTYGAPMDVLVHAGMPLIVDRRSHVSTSGAG